MSVPDCLCRAPPTKGDREPARVRHVPPELHNVAPPGCCSGARSGDGGFTLACISGRSGVVSFNIATSPRPVREKVRPARSKHPKFDVFEVAGRILSRVEWGRGRAGRILSRLSALHRPRNSPWPDTTPALPPSPEQFLARHYPGPAAAHRHRGLARRHSNFACNSPAACSNIEFASLELQRFLGLLKFGSIELHAKFVWRWPCEPVLALPTGCLHRGRALRPLRRFPDRWCLVCCVGSLDLCRAFGTKFSLLGFLVVTTV